MPKITPFISQTSAAVSAAAPLNANRLALSGSAVPRLSPKSVRAPRLQAERTTAARLDNREIARGTEQLGETIGQAAMVYADRQSTLEASDAALVFQKQIRGLWLGQESADGKSFTPGYASTTARAGVDAYRPFVASVDEARHTLANTLDDSAKSKFLAKTNGAYTGLMNQAASHAAGSQRQWESQQASAQTQALYQTLDDELTTGNMEAVAASVADHLTQMRSERVVAVDKIPALYQDMMRGLASHLASTPGSSTKLANFQNTFGDNFDLATSTHFNKLTTAAAKEENRLIQQHYTDTERELRQIKQLNDREWFTWSMKDPTALDLNAGLEMVSSGMLSPSMYLAVKDRRETRSHLAGIPADLEIMYKQQLVLGQLSTEDFLQQTMEYDDATMRRMGNFAVQNEGYERRNDLRYGYEKIERIVSGGSRLPTSQMKVLTAQRSYETLLDTVSAEQALNQVLQQYSQAEQVTPEIIEFSDGTVINPDTLSFREAQAKINALKNNPTISPDEIDRAEGILNRAIRNSGKN